MEKEIVKLWDEYLTTKTWWTPDDVTFGAFMEWIKEGKPNIDLQVKIDRRNAFEAKNPAISREETNKKFDIKQ